MKFIELDLTHITSAAGLHAYLQQKLALPPHYGRNLDALYDCLTEINEETQLCVRTSAVPPAYAPGLLTVLRDAADANPCLRLTLEEGAGSSFADLGFAKLDTGRRQRTGFPEVVYCAGKPDAHLQEIYLRLYELQGEVFGTRASARQYELVREVLPEAEYDSVSRVLKCAPPKELQGCVAVCTAGTADIPVAEEAAQTLEYFGVKAERYYDVGVCGLQRLLHRIGAIRRANVIIAVAGMEGALASVIGGLVDKPVIAVPTSVGYGANLQGVAALLTMINSCANGVTVVNIDNGYGAGYSAAQINRLICRQK